MSGGRSFSGEDVDFLSQNLHNRYLAPSEIVAHAVVTKDIQNKKSFSQYHIPQGSQEAPRFVSIKNIEEIERNGKIRYRALTLDDIPMYASRFIDGELDGREFQIAYFSPRVDRKEPNWGDDTVPSLLQQAASSQPVRIKGGNILTIQPQSVLERTHCIKRLPDQNTVMGNSATQAYEEFHDKWIFDISPQMGKIFHRAIHSPWQNPFYRHYRAEWVHAFPYTLCPMSVDPQKEENLAAAPQWANTEMMLLSHIVKWFALNCPDAIEQIKPHFYMLLNSEIVERIIYQINITLRGHLVHLVQDVKVLKQEPVLRKPTDLTQATAIVHAMLNSTPPVSTFSLFAPPLPAPADEITKKRKIEEIGDVEKQDEAKHARMELK